MVTLLPEPDSPTTPRISPSSRLRLTPSTARSTPLEVGNSTERSWISRSGMSRGRRGGRGPGPRALCCFRVLARLVGVERHRYETVRPMVLADLVSVDREAL